MALLCFGISLVIVCFRKMFRAIRATEDVVRQQQQESGVRGQDNAGAPPVRTAVNDVAQRIAPTAPDQKQFPPANPRIPCMNVLGRYLRYINVVMGRLQSLWYIVSVIELVRGVWYTLVNFKVRPPSEYFPCPRLQYGSTRCP